MTHLGNDKLKMLINTSSAFNKWQNVGGKKSERKKKKKKDKTILVRKTKNYSSRAISAKRNETSEETFELLKFL